MRTCRSCHLKHGAAEWQYVGRRELDGLNMRHMVLFLVIVAGAVGCSHASLGDALTVTQSAALAQEVLRHTPEQVHFAKGTVFRWVLLTEGRSDHPEAFPAIRAALASQYTLYLNQAELPPGAERSDGMGPMFVDGFAFSVTIRRVDANTIEVDYSDYEGSLAGGSQTIRYRWRRNRWRAVWASPQMVS
jgi:hypothetical protein